MGCKHWLRSMKRFLVCLLSTRALMIQLKLKVIWKLCLSRAQSWSSFDSSQDKEPRTSGTHRLQQITNQKVFYNCQRLAIELTHGAEEFYECYAHFKKDLSEVLAVFCIDLD